MIREWFARGHVQEANVGFVFATHAQAVCGDCTVIALAVVVTVALSFLNRVNESVASLVS